MIGLKYVCTNFQTGLTDSKSYDVMRLYMMLHCDHEGVCKSAKTCYRWNHLSITKLGGNVSAHTAHVIGSALADVYYSVSGGVNRASLRFIKDGNISIGIEGLSRKSSLFSNQSEALGVKLSISNWNWPNRYQWTSRPSSRSCKSGNWIHSCTTAHWLGIMKKLGLLLFTRESNVTLWKSEEIYGIPRHSKGIPSRCAVVANCGEISRFVSFIFLGSTDFYKTNSGPAASLGGMVCPFNCKFTKFCPFYFDVYRRGSHTMNLMSGKLFSRNWTIERLFPVSVGGNPMWRVFWAYYMSQWRSDNCFDNLTV